MAMVNVNVEKNATVVEAHDNVYVDFVELLINDGAESITFGFDSAIANGNTRTLKAGEYIKNEEIKINTLYYKTAANPAAFRFWGKKFDL
jgi:hypothetical protein